MHINYSFFLAPALCLAQVPAPVISFDKTHHDFGKIGHDQKVYYRSKVMNKGSAPLQIKEIRPSCGCSYSMVGQWSLAPGEETFIEVHFDPTGLIGNVHKSLSVLSDDPANPDILLTFEASVTHEIMPSTTAIFFHDVPRGGPAMTKTIRLQSGNDMPVAVTDAKIPGAPYIACAPQQDGNDVILNISIDGRLIPKQSQHGVENMTVRTASKKVPIMQFHIQWDVKAAIVAAPSRVFWTDSAGKELRVAITLSHPEGRPFKILEAKPSLAQISVAGINKNAAAEHKFEIILSPKTKAGAYRETLSLKLDDPGQQTLELPIVAILQ
jgi:hypothetical protein